MAYCFCANFTFYCSKEHLGEADIDLTEDFGTFIFFVMTTSTINACIEKTSATAVYGMEVTSSIFMSLQSL